MSYSDTDKTTHSIEAYSTIMFTSANDAVSASMGNPNEVDAFKGLKYCRGFHANATGKLVIRPPQDIATSASNITINVTAGTYYPYSVGMFLTSAYGTSANLYGNIVALR